MPVMFNLRTGFTYVPLLGVFLYGLSYFNSIEWLGILALLVCLPALFNRFVSGDFLFVLFVLVLITAGTIFFKEPMLGAANGFIIWVLISVIFDLYTVVTRRPQPAELSPEKLRRTSEGIKSTYIYDINALLSKKATIKFKQTQAPVTEYVTKFGGQPVWLEQPQWPLSRSSGKPMRFICQIALVPELFGEKKAKMAYIFYSGGIDDIYETFEMDGGENAVILQPGTVNIPITNQTMGKTLECGNKKAACEFIIESEIEDDNRFIPNYEYILMDDKMTAVYDKTINVNKLGGTPYFLQDDVFPEPGSWQLLLQLHNDPLPFEVNFGTGMAYAFINKEGTEAKFFWQK